MCPYVTIGDSFAAVIYHSARCQGFNLGTSAHFNSGLDYFAQCCSGFFAARSATGGSTGERVERTDTPSWHRDSCARYGAPCIDDYAWAAASVLPLQTE
jgi:hypothetical protein